MWTTCKWNAQTKTTNLLCIAVHGFDKRLQKYILLFCECTQSAVEVQTKLTTQLFMGLEFINCFWACASYHLSHNTNLTLEVIGCMLWKIEGMQALYPQSYIFRWTVQNTTKVPNASLFKIVFMVELGAIGRLHQTSYLIVGYTQGIIDQFRMGSKFVTRFLIRFSQLLTLYKHSQVVKHRKVYSKMCWTNQYQIMLQHCPYR